MTIFDYGVLAVLLLSLLVGFWRGVVSEILALLAWILAFLVARKMWPAASVWLQGLFPDPSWQYPAAFALVFVIVLLVMGIIRLLLTHLLRAVGMGLIDRLLGAVFGLVRGALLVLIAVMLAGMTKLPKEPWWRNSVFAPPLETAVIAVKSRLPANLADKIKYH